MDTPHKRCKRCDHDKPITEFRKRKRKLVGGGVTIYHEARCKPCDREYDIEGWYRNRGLPVPEGSTPRERLPVGPFREWVIDRWETYGSLTVLAELCGVPERTLWRVRYESASVNLGTVDRALCGEGSTTLCELYPALYPEMEQAA